MQSCYKGPNEIGIDEAGRGCLAGPVAVGAVILPEDFKHDLIIDSKKLKREQRIEAIKIIEEVALFKSVILIDHEIIDEINITNAVLLGAHQMINEAKPSLILMDGNHFKRQFNLPTGDISHTPYPYLCVTKGDSKYHSIAAASILAKTYRDEFMAERANEYPGYGWESNFGYATAKHYEGIYKQGITPIHRLTFIKKELDVLEMNFK